MAALRTVPLEELKKMGVNPDLKSFRRAQDLKRMSEEEADMISTRMRQGFKAYCLHLSNQRSVPAPTSPGTEFPELNERCRVCGRFVSAKA